MTEELDRIISNRETLEDSIDAEELKKLRVYREARALSRDSLFMAQVESMHILGGSSDPAMDGTFCSYRDANGSEALLTNLPTGYPAETLLTENLAALDIRFTAIDELDLSRMKRLVRLNLANNRYLKTVTGWEQLGTLQELDIHNTQLDDLSVIGACSRLRSLNASGLKLGDPRFLTKLPELSHLDLKRSRIDRFPDLSPLRNLKMLNLDGAQLLPVLDTALPASLEFVSLAHSSLHRIPESLRDLPNLRRLDLSGLHLRALPDWLADLGLEFHSRGVQGYLQNTGGIILTDTVIEGIDMSIFEQPQEIIRQWFQERRSEDRLVPMNEVKVVFLGDGDAGKSLTIARLMDDGVLTPDSESRITQGIATYQKVFDLEGREVTVHFWDFGGQEILHSIHRMFLTERTLYVVMVNAREDSYADRIRYWMHTLKSVAGNSPVLLALNKIDMNPGLVIDEQEIRGMYPNLSGIVRISALRDSTEAFRARFTDVLLRVISEQPLLGTLLPASWKQLRRRIGALDCAYITKADFDAICDACEVSDRSDVRESLLSWFHDLGICFHRNDNLRQDAYVVLQPAWVSHALAKILYELHAWTRNGLVSCEEINHCLGMADGSEYVYSESDVRFILDLMREYRFSYQWSEKEEFIPALCSQSAPPIADEYLRDPSAFQFRMEYTYLPIHLLHQMMIGLGEVLDISNVWASGARFIWSGASALVMCEGHRLHISIRSGGSQREAQSCLTVLRNALDQIHSAGQIEAGRLQVCYRQGDKAEWFSYEALTAMAGSGIGAVDSEVFGSPIPISYILGHMEQLQKEEEKRLISHIAAICEKVQTNSYYWSAGEEAMSIHLHEMLSLQGYQVSDSSISVEAGEHCALDIRLAAISGIPWAVGGVLSVRSTNKRERYRWSDQIEKLVMRGMAAAAPIVVTVTFASCKLGEFPALLRRYSDSMESFGVGEQPLFPKETEVFSHENELIRGVRSVYDCAGVPLTTYHFIVRIGFDQVIEEKREQRLRTPNNEYKVVFLGDGEAGKSLTVARLHEPELDIEAFDGEVTPGIDIRGRCYEVDGINVQVNFWDFGGQEILHSIHRLFLSKRTLYVVILNARNGNQDERARFWLRYIETYASKAPVMLVLNKIDQNKHAFLNEPLLRRQFEDLDIRKFLRISALKWTKEEFKRDFIDHLEAHLRTVTAQESPLSKSQWRVRNTLVGWKEPRISLEEYEQVCRDQKITDEAHQKALLKRLEHSGICVCFAGHSYTEQYRLLEPMWITNAIYAILFNLHSQAKNGIISHDTIQTLFQKDPKELKCVRTIRYKPDEVEFILRVMRTYRLSFEIPDLKQEFLPMLCPQIEASKLDEFLEEGDRLEFHMCLNYLPSEVLYQFMVARQRELDLEKDSIWLNGALLWDKEGCCAAVVREDNVLKFHISRSHGLPHARSYMDSLRHDMELIIRKNGLREPETRVIYKCREGDKVIEEPFDYDRLIKCERYGIRNTVSKRMDRAVAIRDILDQTYRSETVQYETLVKQLLRACRILQENYDNWGKTEPVLNRTLRDLLRAMGYHITDQPESGASSTWKGPGRPDMIVNFEDSASNVLIEALRIFGTGTTDAEEWDKHLKRMIDNYNSCGYRMMVLMTYVTSSEENFDNIAKFYHDRMCINPPAGGVGAPERYEQSKDKTIPELIRVTQADYYTKGYSPTIYHFQVHIPKAKKNPEPQEVQPEASPNT